MEGDDGRLFSPSAARNREPILQVLRRVLPVRGLVLEIAGGSGEHVVHFAAGLPGLEFQHTDPDPAAVSPRGSPMPGLAMSARLFCSMFATRLPRLPRRTRSSAST